jgi:hypothetical protein
MWQEPTFQDRNQQRQEARRRNRGGSIAPSESLNQIPVYDYNNPRPHQSQYDWTPYELNWVYQQNLNQFQSAITPTMPVGVGSVCQVAQQPSSYQNAPTATTSVPGGITEYYQGQQIQYQAGLIAELEEQTRQAVEKKAEKKAQKLLLEWLDEEQLNQYKRTGSFVAIGNHTKRKYTILRGNCFNIKYVEDQKVVMMCFLPQGSLALGDVNLAQKIMLENDEEAALEIANISSYVFVYRGLRIAPYC